MSFKDILKESLEAKNKLAENKQTSKSISSLKKMLVEEEEEVKGEDDMVTNIDGADVEPLDTDDEGEERDAPLDMGDDLDADEEDMEDANFGDEEEDEDELDMDSDEVTVSNAKSLDDLINEIPSLISDMSDGQVLKITKQPMFNIGENKKAKSMKNEKAKGKKQNLDEDAWMKEIEEAIAKYESEHSEDEEQDLNEMDDDQVVEIVMDEEEDDIQEKANFYAGKAPVNKGYGKKYQKESSCAQNESRILKLKRQLKESHNMLGKLQKEADQLTAKLQESLKINSNLLTENKRFQGMLTLQAKGVVNNVNAKAIQEALVKAKDGKAVESIVSKLITHTINEGKQTKANQVVEKTKDNLKQKLSEAAKDAKDAKKPNVTTNSNGKAGNAKINEEAAKLGNRFKQLIGE